MECKNKNAKSTKRDSAPWRYFKIIGFIFRHNMGAWFISETTGSGFDPCDTCETAKNEFAIVSPGNEYFPCQTTKKVDYFIFGESAASVQRSKSTFPLPKPQKRNVFTVVSPENVRDRCIYAAPYTDYVSYAIAFILESRD